MAALPALGLGLAAAQTFEPQAYTVPSDPKATYQYETPTRKGDVVVLISQRNGKSGVSFTRREIKCASATFRYTGEGDTYDAMSKGKATGNFAPITDGSVTSYAAGWACAHPAVAAKRR